MNRQDNERDTATAGGKLGGEEDNPAGILEIAALSAVQCPGRVLWCTNRLICSRHGFTAGWPKNIVNREKETVFLEKNNGILGSSEDSLSVTVLLMWLFVDDPEK